MLAKARVLPMIGALIATLFIGGFSAAPASAATDEVDKRNHEMSMTKVAPAAPGEATTQAVTCNAGVNIDPWAMYFDCTLDSVTNVSARCTDGFTFTPITVPPGSYRIIVDCYPSFFANLIFT
jgi:hypothetical protein